MGFLVAALGFMLLVGIGCLGVHKRMQGRMWEKNAHSTDMIEGLFVGSTIAPMQKELKGSKGSFEEWTLGLSEHEQESSWAVRVSQVSSDEEFVIV